MIIGNDDKTITSRIADGDREAENYLFLQFRDRIKLMVRIRLKKRIPDEDHKDIISEIQQAILLSLRKGSFNSEMGKTLDAYIAGIASNVVGQYFRKLNKEKANTDIDNLQDIADDGNNLSDIINEERREKLRKYLKNLKPKYAEVLYLRFYENKSIDEISQKLRIEKRRVSERLNYAFKLLLKECKKENYFQYSGD
ncbi:MAG TPA: sigma-70 family RNA polymerase sigma factor [Ignavibacteriaceae bacterium]|nr:sigma-70 family RNA polymerase sigma factor [Ignavibacteriaceae bacterium]